MKDGETPTARGLRHGLWFLGLLTLALALVHLARGEVGFDAHAYWAAWRHHLYAASPESTNAYLYSPLFAQAIWPLTLLPWPVFCTLWLALIAGVYLWLLAPVPLRWRLPILLACTLDIVSGNVWAFFALVLVFGFTYPALWAFPALTKVTPVLGPVWFAARREWRALLVCVSAIVLLLGVSILAAPHSWGDWVRFLEHAKPNGNMAPAFNPPTRLLLAVELPCAVGLTVWAAVTDRPWLLPVAMLFANPVLTANAVVILTAIPRIQMRQRSRFAELPNRSNYEPTASPPFSAPHTGPSPQLIGEKRPGSATRKAPATCRKPHLPPSPRFTLEQNYGPTVCGLAESQSEPAAP